MLTTTLPSRMPFMETPALSTAGISNTAEFIRQRFRDIGIKDSETFGAGIRYALAEISTIEEECAMPDWDGYHALPINSASVYYAKVFLDALPIGTPAPEVSADPDGEISFEWYKSPDYLMSISFSKSGEIHFAHLAGARRYHGSEPFSELIPANIIQGIRNLKMAA